MITMSNNTEPYNAITSDFYDILKSFKIPRRIVNPHFLSVYRNAEDAQRAVADLAALVVKEHHNEYAKKLYFDTMKLTMERMNVYLLLEVNDIKWCQFNNNKILLAAVLEVFHNSGLYSKNEKE